MQLKETFLSGKWNLTPKATAADGRWCPNRHMDHGMENPEQWARGQHPESLPSSHTFVGDRIPIPRRGSFGFYNMRTSQQLKIKTNKYLYLELPGGEDKATQDRSSEPLCLVSLL
ncbi:hypothetical protein P7K49_036802 [Saguinus oedipus]|uniref:Uncharacterized protein n=1 Tax=Saguinus oedipus TaxID=9490 RepID=A0ABQ9TL68_SAGOE|nr:hypothetical protein P7K49_036802 [Saguinus oedipus]